MSFLEDLYGYVDEPKQLYLWTLEDKYSTWFDTEQLTQMQAAAERMVQAGKSVYFGVGGTQSTKRKDERVTNDEVTMIPGLWIDIDLRDNAHKQDNLPATVEDATELFGEYDPTILVHSGYGLHAYFLFREPWDFAGPDEEEERQLAASVSQRFQGLLRARAKERGWKLDSTHDLARVLRLPGTLNRKKEQPVPVQIIRDNGPRYNPSDFYDLPEVREAKESRKNQSEFSEDCGPVENIIENCAFIQHCRKDAAKLPEPEWVAMVSNLVRAQGGREAIHDLSRPYPGYTEKETENKIRHAEERMHGPQTCEYIRESLEFDCRDCGVKAPCNWSTARIGRARATVKRITEPTTEQVLKEEVIGALAVLSKDDPIEYELFREQCRKNKVSLKAMDSLVRQQKAKNNHLRLVEPGEVQEKDTVKLEAPLELKYPENWAMTDKGVFYYPPRADDKPVVKQVACGNPLIISKSVHNVDSGIDKIQLAFFIRNAWKYVTIPRSTALTRQGIVTLADKGLNVSSETAKWLVQWVQELEQLNEIPCSKAVSRYGWYGADHFLPGAAGELEVDIDEDGNNSIVSAYHARGGIVPWVQIAEKYRKFPYVRFTLAAAFAAPLLRPLRQRVFVIHNWGGSRGGKTATLKLALSAWGNPDDLIVSFNATRVGLERQAEFFCDLPLGIDERQVAGSNDGFVDQLLYMLASGKGKVRGNKTGGVQHTSSWRSIILTTGEQPLSSDSSTAGIKTRCLELFGIPIPSENLAANLHRGLQDAYGCAGTEFIRRLIENLEPGEAWLKGEFESLRQELEVSNKGCLSSHLDSVATVCTADLLLSQWIFGMDAEQARAEALKMGNDILSKQEKDDAVLDSTRNWDALKVFVESNLKEIPFLKKGECNIPPGRVGYETETEICIFPAELRTYLKNNGGMNYNKLTLELAERGLLEWKQEGNQRKVAIPRRTPGRQTVARVIVIRKENMLNDGAVVHKDEEQQPLLSEEEEELF